MKNSTERERNKRERLLNGKEKEVELNKRTQKQKVEEGKGEKVIIGTF